MRVVTDGTLRGKTLELMEETGLPEGARVRVTLETGELTLDQKRRKAAALCGSWSGDESLAAVFQAIEGKRQETSPRCVNYDAAS